MGLARVGGMCTNQHNCVIGELGVTNSRGKPYPSAGFTAVFVMAHEIGHNLGMHHDHSVGSLNFELYSIALFKSSGWLYQRWIHHVSIERD